MASDDIKLAIQKNVDTMLSEIKENAEQKIKEQLKIVQEDLEKNFRSKYLAVLVTAGSLVLTTLVLGASAQRTSVNQAVIELQKDVASAQKVIIESTDKVQKTKEDLSTTEARLKVATDQLQQLRSEYEKAVAEAKADAARKPR